MSGPPPSDRVYINDLPSKLTEETLNDVIGAYGSIEEVQIIKGPRIGAPCSAIIRFESEHEALWLVENLHGGIPQGFESPVRVRFADPLPNIPQAGHANMASTDTIGSRSGPYVEGTPPPDNDTSLYVTGLPVEMTTEMINQLFSPFGQVLQCKIAKGHNRGGSQVSSAILRFATNDQAKHCKEKVHGQVIPGLAEPMQVRHISADAAYGRLGPPIQQQKPIDIIVKGFVDCGGLPGCLGYHNNENSSVYIAGLPCDTEDVHLYRMFGPLGTIGVKGIHIKRYEEEGIPWVIAFVNFLEPAAAKAAIQLYNGVTMPDGNILKVAMKLKYKQPLPTNSITKKTDEQVEAEAEEERQKKIKSQPLEH